VKQKRRAVRRIRGVSSAPDPARDNQPTSHQMETPMALRSLTPSNGGSRSALALNPFGFLQREIDRLFQDVTRGPDLAGQAQVMLVPNIDVTETADEIVVSVEMPGLQRDDVQITVDDDILTIRGEKRVEREEGDEDRNYHVSERSYGVFLRMLQLPAGIDPSSVEASMSNGVLRIRIPKPARSEPKKIEVKDAPQQGNGQGAAGAQQTSQGKGPQQGQEAKGAGSGQSRASRG
jgi:HSP20 family protein